MQADPGTELLAVFGVRHAEDLDIGDLGMGVEELLHLAGIDVLAAADDHVLDPADDVAITLLIHHRQIAGMHPAALIDGLAAALLLAPIAAHDGIAPGQELARHARRQDAARAIHDLHLEMRLAAP